MALRDLLPLAAVGGLGLAVYLERAAQAEAQAVGEPDGYPDGLDVAPPFPEESPTMPLQLPGGHNEWDNQIVYMAGLYGLSDPTAPLLVKAIIAHESAWNERARGDFYTAIAVRANPGAYRGEAFFAGYCSIGLMQVNRCAHPQLAAQYDLRDGNQAILAGGQILAGAYQAWWPDYRSVLARYNGSGPMAVAYGQRVGATFAGFAAQMGVAV
jgi:hypothetical protein